ncbi:MAG TPA: hypothetical protein VHU41_03990, partial [Thermoanaerobaculia bacterium]|nr:hypothetical protein [Thermoanaerobaculia bacterium]
MRKTFILTATTIFTATLCLADANVQEKTQLHLGGAIGGIANAFGGRATHEGITSNTFVKGNRRARMTEGSSEIVDLDAEKVYKLDLGRKTYTVETFDEIRRRFEEQKERAEKRSARQDNGGEKPQGPEYEVDISVKDTGQKQAINGYDTHEVVTTISVHEKGKPIEKAGGSIFKADMWIGPRIREMREIGDFERRYFAKLYGKEFGAADMQQMAMLIATNPMFAKAAKAFADKRSSFDGTPIRTILTFEAVAGTEQQASSDEGGGGIGGAIGGLMRHAHRRDADSGPQRSTLFDSTNEILKASATATSADVSIPAGFTQK